MCGSIWVCIVAADARQCCLLFCAALAVDTGAVEVIVFERGPCSRKTSNAACVTGNSLYACTRKPLPWPMD